MSQNPLNHTSDLENQTPQTRGDFHNSAIEFTAFQKIGGTLTKVLWLAADGHSVNSDPSACFMSYGIAKRIVVGGVEEFADIINDLKSTQAIALGALREDLPDEIDVTTQNRLNGNERVIARTKKHISYRKNKPAFALIDFDRKGMPKEMGTRIGDDFWETLCTILPALRDAAYVIRRSTSAGMYNGEIPLLSSGGWHVYLVVKNGKDVKRFLKALHDRCWLAGFGWYYISEAGSLLERSIIDTSVFSPERLVFEGPPVVNPPLRQDAEMRKASYALGDMLDTPITCPELTAEEQSRVDRLKADEHVRMRPEAEKVKAAWVEAHAHELHTRKGVPLEEARRKALAMCDKQELHQDCVLEFVDPDLHGDTVADVLANPDRYCDQVLADPIEGVAYGRTTAKVFLRDGVPWINSFAHGGVRYSLIPNVPAAEPQSGSYLAVMGNGSTSGSSGNGAAGAASIGTAAGGGAGGAGTGSTNTGSASPSAMGLLKTPIYVQPGELPRIVNEAEDALMQFDRDIYQRGGKLVRPVLSVLKASGGREFRDWRLIDVTRPYLILQFSQAATFLQNDKRAKKYVTIDPPEKVAEAYLHKQGSWKLPLISGFANAPFLHADGTVHDWEGYDPISGLLCKWEQPFPPVPLTPNKADAMAALAELKEPISEFPFVTGEDQAAALSAMLTAVDRRGMNIAPLHAFTAPESGTGKGLLIDVIATIATGEIVQAIDQSSNQEEFTKCFGAELLDGASLIAIDNCQHVLEGSLLNIAITQQKFGVRVLGKSQNLPVINNATTFANGNNLTVGADMTRRVIRCKMDAEMERPETRHFKNERLLETVKANRAKLVIAALTVLRAWHIARPNVDLQVDPLDFKDWSQRVREALIWLGEDDPGSTMKDVQEDDPYRQARAAVFTKWYEVFNTKAVLVRDVIGAALNHPDFHAALMAVAGARTGREVSPERLGRWLAKNKRSIANGLTVVSAGGIHGGFPLWQIQKC